MKIDEIDTNSEQIREFLERPPANILRWGITVIFLIVFAMFFVTWVIKYPTVIPSQITITSQIPPHKVVAQTSGDITHLFVSENDVVKANESIAIIQNTAKYSDVDELSVQVNNVKSILKNETLLSFKFKEDLQLGTIQQAYGNFKKAYEEYLEYQVLLESNQGLQILNNQIKINKQKLQSLLKQLKIYSNELKLSKLDYERDRGLFEQNVISAKELEDKKRTLLAAERNYEGVKNSRTNVEIIISDLKKEINGITISSIESKSRLTRTVNESFKDLKNAILTWKQNYLLVSPIEGTVSFFHYWAKNQHVNAGDEVLSVVPKFNNEITGRMLMPIQNSGQVEAGQKVVIRLTGYPYQEYGMLLGKIKNISLQPSQNAYAVEVELPSSLRTTYNKEIELKSELSGSAEIITEDLRLLERIFYQIRKIFIK